MFTDWQFIVAAIIASFVIGLSRGGFTAGVAFIGVLIMAQIVPTPVAAAFILPLLCFSDPFGMYAYRQHVHWPSFKVIFPGGLVGLAIGTAVFFYLNDNLLKLIVALLSLYMVFDRVIFSKRYAVATVLPKWVGYLLGVIAGITTFIIHAGHPPVSAYLLPQQLSRFLFIGTFAILFLLFNYIKLLPYAWLGILDWSLLSISVYYFPVVLAGFFTGRFLVKRMSDKLFFQIFYVGIFILGLKLLVESIWNIVT